MDNSSPWSVADVARLLELHEAKTPIEVICQALPSRSRHAIRTKHYVSIGDDDHLRFTKTHVTNAPKRVQQASQITSALSAGDMSYEPASSPNQGTHAEMERKPRVNRDRWSPGEIEVLCSMKDSGASWKEIFKALPRRSSGAIKVKHYNLMKGQTIDETPSSEPAGAQTPSTWTSPRSTASASRENIRHMAGRLRSSRRSAQTTISTEDDNDNSNLIQQTSSGDGDDEDSGLMHPTASVNDNDRYSSLIQPTVPDEVDDQSPNHMQQQQLAVEAHVHDTLGPNVTLVNRGDRPSDINELLTGPREDTASEIAGNGAEPTNNQSRRKRKFEQEVSTTSNLNVDRLVSSLSYNGLSRDAQIRAERHLQRFIDILCTENINQQTRQQELAEELAIQIANNEVLKATNEALESRIRQMAIAKSQLQEDLTEVHGMLVPHLNTLHDLHDVFTDLTVQMCTVENTVHVVSGASGRNLGEAIDALQTEVGKMHEQRTFFNDAARDMLIDAGALHGRVFRTEGTDRTEEDLTVPDSAHDLAAVTDEQ